MRFVSISTDDGPRAALARDGRAYPYDRSLDQLIADGLLDPSLETVVINSGDGLKTLDAVADRVGPKTTIPPRYEAFAEFWKARG